jgi:hypothetical protein
MGNQSLESFIINKGNKIQGVAITTNKGDMVDKCISGPTPYCFCFKRTF